MKNATLTALIMFITFSCLACSSSDTTNAITITDKIDTQIFKNNPGVNVEVIELSGGSYGDSYSNENIVIRSKKDYKSFWNNLYGGRTPTPERPTVNFSKEMLVFTVRETKPNGGYSTQISKVVNTNKELAVKITNTNPGDGCMTTQALTTPFQLVKVKKQDKPVKFYEETVTKNCS